MLRDSFTVTETVRKSVAQRLAHLPMPLGILVPKSWGFRRELACGLAALLVVSAWLLFPRPTASATPKGSEFGQCIRPSSSGSGSSEDETPPVPIVKLPPSQPASSSSSSEPAANKRPSLLQQEEVDPCDTLTPVHDYACGFTTDVGICVNAAVAKGYGSPRYLAQPVIVHREQPVPVTEPLPHCTQPRQVTRYRRITALYRDVKDLPQRIMLNNAFCVEFLVEVFERGQPWCHE